jgi:DNA-binding PadR family transcriptional regulator
VTTWAPVSQHFVLPRAESVIYAEPKRLVRAGLATVRSEKVGRRTRQVYAITEAGRVSLQEWLRTPTADPALELDALMRLLFADAGELDDLAAALDRLDDWAAQRYQEGVEICRGYLAGDAPFPGRLHISVLFATFYARLYRGVREWVAEAKAEIDTWPGTAEVGLTPGTRRLLQGLVDEAASPAG